MSDDTTWTDGLRLPTLIDAALSDNDDHSLSPGQVVASALLSPANREAVLRELRAAWGDTLGGQPGGLWHADELGGAFWESLNNPPPLYRWAEPPRQPAPSTESETT